MTNILLIGADDSFVLKDKEIFEKLGYNVEKTYFNINYFSYCKKVKELVKKSDLVFGWFASAETFPSIYYAKKYSIPSIVMAGGYDTKSYPEIKYGAFRRFNYKESIPARYVYKNVDKILTINPDMINDIYNFTGVDKKKMVYLPTGFDYDFWDSKIDKQDIVLTVGFISKKNIIVKGYNHFFECASYFPDKKFILAAKILESKTNILDIPDNVHIFSPNIDELRGLYQKAKVFCLFSYTEGLSNVLCESMLCRCIPVATDIYANRLVMDDIGFYTSYGDIDSHVDSIDRALSSKNTMGDYARERIIRYLPIEKRVSGLKHILEEFDIYD